MKPRLEVAGCYFAHVEPWLDPENMLDLWYFDGPPDDAQKLARIFQAVSNRHIFAGHFHEWLIATPERILGWLGYNPIVLDPGRFFCRRWRAVPGSLGIVRHGNVRAGAI